MDMSKERKVDPVRPYDDSMWDHWTLYDTMPYVWNPDLSSEKHFAKESGNIIKSHRCLMKEPYEVKHE